MATTYDSTREAPSRLRLAGGLVIAGSAAGIPVGIATSTFDPGLATPGTPGFLVGGVYLSALHLALLAGFCLLAASGVAGRGWVGRLGWVVALAGLTGQFLGESLLRVSFALGNGFFSFAMPALGLGLILLGVAVIRSREWTGWRRYVLLATGLYIPLVMVPAFVLAQGPSFPAITAWQLFFVASGVAAWQARG